MNPELINLIKESDRILRLWKMDLANYRNRDLCKQLRNRLNSAIRKRKSAYYRTIFEGNKNNTKKYGIMLTICWVEEKRTVSTEQLMWLWLNL